MAKFYEPSRSRLASCHPELQRLFNEVVKHWDCAILEGRRDEATQNRYVAEGRSKVPYPESKHNRTPSYAVDAVPYPMTAEDWKETPRLYLFVGFVRGVAAMLGIPIRVGADWDGDGHVKDQNFHDLPHFELVEKAPGEGV